MIIKKMSAVFLITAAMFNSCGDEERNNTSEFEGVWVVLADNHVGVLQRTSQSIFLAKKGIS